MKQAYANICERCYIKALPVVADSGEIGGDTSVEYMALADAGEASLVYCDDCGFAADDEAASTKVVVTEGPGDGTLTKVETPGMGTIEAVAKFFGGIGAAAARAFYAAGYRVAVFYHTNA